MNIKKNDEYIVEIIDMGINAEGIAKIDGYTVFVQNAIIGENVKIKILKANKNFGFAKIIEIIEKSKDRVEPFCNVYEKCGGCNMQHLSYDAQLEYKLNVVKNNFKKFGLDSNKIVDIIGMEHPYEYRNKAQYPFGINRDGQAITGFYGKQSHNIIENNICKIENSQSESIVKYIKELVQKYNLSVYNEVTKKGYLRHVVIKIGFSTNQIMVIFVTNNRENKLKEISEELVEFNKNIVTIVQNINTENTNVILGEQNNILYGNGYIQDKLGEYTFNISSLSFYQINPIQTEKLYNIVKEYLGNDNNILFDLYCGIGTIGIYCNKNANKIYGIEVVKQAIDDANENAKLNNVNNIEFMVGEAENSINDLYNKKIEADAIIVDPPRKGLDEKLINVLLEKSPKKIVYVSCNNATLSRDLQKLSINYDIQECTLIDMFPNTHHVECVAVLRLK